MLQERVQVPRGVLIGLAVLVLFGIGSAIHNAGWSQGFSMGLLAGGADGAKLAPYLVGYGTHGWGFGGLIGGFFGLIFRIGFLVLLFALLARVFGFWRWRGQGGPCGPHWHRHWHGEAQTHPAHGQPGPKAESSANQPQGTSRTNL